MAKLPDWMEHFPGAVTVCDRNYIILYMNEKAAATFSDFGGKSLVGKNLLSCHSNDKSIKIMSEILLTGKPNVYTIEKNGIRKIIYQSPWFEDSQSQASGLVELSLEIPEPLPHFVRN